MPTQQRAPASTQKLLTALIVAERGYLDQPITIHAERHATRSRRSSASKPGETYRRIDLLARAAREEPERCRARAGP